MARESPKTLFSFQVWNTASLGEGIASPWTLEGGRSGWASCTFSRALWVALNRALFMFMCVKR